MEPSHRISRRLRWCCLLLLGLSGASCRLIETASSVPRQAIRTVTTGSRDANSINPVEVQQSLMRFADGFSTGLILAVEKLRRGTNELDPAESLRWKIGLTSEVLSIASGPNATANLLDLTVFVSAAREILESYPQTSVFGESAIPLLETCRTGETEIWRLAEQVIEPDQRTELREVIREWRRQNPNPESVLAARSLGFTLRTAKSGTSDPVKPGSVLDLLRLDPLSKLDPATREIAQSRLLAERSLFVAKKMPTLIRWQTELLALHATELPNVRQLVTNATQVSASIERVSHLAASLPALLASEREAILHSLESQEKSLIPLVQEARQALLAGSTMSDSLNTTLITFDALMKRFGVGETNTNSSTASATNSEPFRIQDYARTAERLEAAAARLTELLHAFDQVLGSANLNRLAAQVQPVVQDAKSGGREIVDYAFRKGVLLVLLALAAGLIHRYLGSRWSRDRHPPTNRP
jgi:hypothetical protein